MSDELTILSSHYANAEHTAIMLVTDKFGAVLRSERDSSPKDWRQALDSKPAAYEPPVVVREVHAAWFRAALRDMGEMDRVRGALNLLQLDLFDGATSFRENQKDVVAIAGALGIDLAAVFDRAEAIKAETQA